MGSSPVGIDETHGLRHTMALDTFFVDGSHCMRSRAFAILTLLALTSLSAQENSPSVDVPAIEQPLREQPELLAPAPATIVIPSKADALLLYKQGRDLEAQGKASEAAAKFKASVSVCDTELASDPTRMDAYTVKCWSLFRLERYKEVIDIGSAGLKVKFDARIVEVMGEAYFFLNDDARAIRNLQRYIDSVGEYGDRVSTAYFYMAEIYMRQKRLDHADIAYSLAVYRDPGVARWWYRYALTVETLGEYQRSYDLFTRALRLSPGMADALAGQTRVKARL